MPVEPLRGKVVLDTNNYYADPDRHIAELDGESATASELLQEYLPESRILKGVQQHLRRPPRHLAAPAGHAERSVQQVPATTSPPSSR